MSSWRQDPLLKAKYNKMRVHLRSSRMPAYAVCGKPVRGLRATTSFPGNATCQMCRSKAIVTLK